VVLFGSDAERDDFLDEFGGFEVGCFLHGYFAEGVDVEAGVG
jgi:hypothetical protein